MSQVTRSRSQTLLFVAGALVAALPIAFGVVRAATTGTDFRYLWSGVAALAGAVVTVRANAARRPEVQAVLALSAGTVLAAATAFLVGARSLGAVLVVAFAFGACVAVGFALVVRSRMG